MSSNSSDSETANTSTHWSTVSKHVVNSYLEANNAVLAAMGFDLADEPDGDSSTADDPSVAELSVGDEDWQMQRSTDVYDDLGVGDYVRFTKSIDQSDVSAFATATGDTNRLHLDEEFAADTRFGGRIAHGTLVAGTISAALARFPGLTIYLSQDLEFHAPVEIGDTVTADCRIVEQVGEDRYRLETTVYADHDEDRKLIDGEAVVIIEELEE
ncbi:MaoC family dehydratase [Natrarchaeobius chitinivorans]|uniref:MaoC family dehydratase n=1 Tax=Natrarchaeobius chitinivorans TaxID=1679083 RepID=A0A3N6MJA4_NATCH|nr:MaoC family dehydratase [Natrarchaeobius chitinivorans]RQG97150.1 MaoC family dehydratase [Natrarchaeobius chitinivorans]